MEKEEKLARRRIGTHKDVSDELPNMHIVYYATRAIFNDLINKANSNTARRAETNILSSSSHTLLNSSRLIRT